MKQPPTSLALKDHAFTNLCDDIMDTQAGRRFPRLDALRQIISTRDGRPAQQALPVNK